MARRGKEQAVPKERFWGVTRPAKNSVGKPTMLSLSVGKFTPFDVTKCELTSSLLYLYSSTFIALTRAFVAFIAKVKGVALKNFLRVVHQTPFFPKPIDNEGGTLLPIIHSGFI